MKIHISSRISLDKTYALINVRLELLKIPKIFNAKNALKDVKDVNHNKFVFNVILWKGMLF